MKKIFYFIILISQLHNIAFSQSPIVETTYLPANGTRFRLVIDTIQNQLPIPSFGQNQVWDYSSAFINICDTGVFETDYPYKYPQYASFFPSATNASSQLSKAGSVHNADGWGFYIIDTTGLWCIGYKFINYVVSTGVTLDTIQYYSKPMLAAPTKMSMITDIYDTAISYVFTNYLGNNVKVKNYAYYHKKSMGYGNLKTPVGSFDNVLLVKTTGSYIDSIFGDPLGNNSYSTFLLRDLGTFSPYFKFVRNNTFASNELMQLTCGDNSCTYIYDGYYILPTDIGSISGHVYDTLGNPIAKGKMLLYREHSNFHKDDILATTTIDAAGYYQFDSIPYGIYRIAARADSSLYPDRLTTFYGNITDNWIDADTLVTNGDTTGVDIVLQYHPPYSGTNNILSGKLTYNLSHHNKNKLTGEPIKDIDISIKRPTQLGDSIVSQKQTDSTGVFLFSGLPDGCYHLYVCIPGLPMYSTYEFAVSNGSSYNNFDFLVSLDSIYATHNTYCANGIDVVNQEKDINIFPNPFTDHTTINLSLAKSSVVKIELSNIIGGKYFMRNEKIYSRGNHSIELNNLNLQSGIYLLKCYIDNFEYDFKLICVRQ